MFEKHKKSIRIVHISFPLRGHKMARPAAEAALAAFKQGRFWEYHDEVFAIYNRITDEQLLGIARKLGLDMKRFQADRRSREIKEAVDRDLRRGETAGVRGTPTVFINGRLLQNRSLEGFSQLIGEALQEGKQGR